MTKKQDSLEELIPTKTDNVIIHGYLNLNRKQIKDWHKAQQRELIDEIIDDCKVSNHSDLTVDEWLSNQLKLKLIEYKKNNL